MSRLILVRHGNTKLNSAQRFWGQTDVELSEDGVRQAERLGNRLAAEKIDTVYASNLSRALVTAEIISSRHGLAVTTCTELAEINFGTIEGLTFDEISKLHPEQARQLADRSLTLKFPGGESIRELNDRVSKFVPRLENHAPEATILIVSHAGVLRLMVCNLLGIGLEHWRQMRLDLASVSIVETYPQGAILNLLNDTSHLELQ